MYFRFLIRFLSRFLSRFLVKLLLVSCFLSCFSGETLVVQSAFAQIVNTEQDPADRNILGTGENPRVGSLAAAAMETAGAALQADFLDFINGDSEFGNSGVLLAGFLYLISIVSALITVAAGGNYKWARYLLIGPPLFFFLTQVRVTSNGADWAFGRREFSQEVKMDMLRGVNKFDEGQREGADVAYFFQFWNLFISDLTQSLVSQLNRDLEGRDMNFVKKVDDYMNLYLTPEIADNDLRLLVHTVLNPNCSEYFNLKRRIANINNPEILAVQELARLSEIENKPVSVFYADGTNASGQIGVNDEVSARLQELGIAPTGTATCQGLWEGAVGYLRGRINEMIHIHLEKNPEVGQEPNRKVALFLQKIGVVTDKYGELVYDEEEVSQNLVKAVDWIVARSLFKEIWANNPFLNTYDFEGRERVLPGVNKGKFSDSDIPDASGAIQQFNVTDVYQHRGEYLAAAMSIPHFQGVVLFLLGACYPFFTLMVIIPGRAGAMLTWMGLWAWVKLWDLGFAVVMMVDDILYTMMPRGPNLIEGEILDPGLALQRVLSIDPSYAAATYYNIIATCLFAVPLATGVFVKRGGGEIINLVQSSWQSKAGGVGASAGSFVRVLQAQTYSDQYHAEVLRRAGIAREQALNGFEAKGIDSEINFYQGLKVATDTASMISAAKKLKGGHLIDASAKWAAGYAEARINVHIKSLKNWRERLVLAHVSKEAYDWGNSKQGFWLSERAVAAKYSSHHFGLDHYMGDLLNLETARGNISDVLGSKGFNNMEDITNRYGQIKKELQNPNLSKTQKAELKAELQDLKPSVNTATSGDSAQFFDQNGFISGLSDDAISGIANSVINGVTAGGPVQ